MIRAAKEKGYDVDFSVINHGAFRSAWYPGMIQDQHFFNMFPFENYLTYF
jgi:2',3'-cyclic-nucleotide 2'-phosphodiesterase (5'-nucleotidase family)